MHKTKTNNVKARRKAGRRVLSTDTISRLKLTSQAPTPRWLAQLTRKRQHTTPTPTTRQSLQQPGPRATTHGLSCTVSPTLVCRSIPFENHPQHPKRRPERFRHRQRQSACRKNAGAFVTASHRPLLLPLQLTLNSTKLWDRPQMAIATMKVRA